MSEDLALFMADGLMPGFGTPPAEPCDLGPLEPDPNPRRNRGGPLYLPPDPEDLEAFPARLDLGADVG